MIRRRMIRQVATAPSVPDEYGELVVNVYTANEILPVPGAKVTIKDGDKIYTYITDSSGKTPSTRIKTPPRSESLRPGAVKPYSTVDITVEKDGYYKNSYVGEQIFSGIKSYLNASLIPAPNYISPENSNLFYNERAQELGGTNG